MSVSQPKFGRAPRLGEHTSDMLESMKAHSLPQETESGMHSMQSPSPQPSPSMERWILAGIRSGWLHTPSPTSLLSDVRVLDLTRVWAGPLATRILGDFGAEAIKISDPRVPLDRLLGTNKSSTATRSTWRCGSTGRRDARCSLTLWRLRTWWSRTSVRG